MLLEVVNLSVSFKTHLGKVKAVRNVSFSIAKGETLAIVGESGCGKSVTAQAIMRLIPEPHGIIESGKIFFNGHDLLTKSKAEIRQIRGKEMGMVFQDPMTSLNPTIKVGNQVMESLIKQKSIPKKIAREMVLELFNLVGISHPEKRIDQYPYEFSGGMRQRVMIAIALAHKPKLLIADEPTTALDVTIQAQILDLMKELQRKFDMSIILITHDLGIVAGICDRVAVMYSGQIVETAPVVNLYHNPKHPYTQGLLHSVFRLDMDKNQKLEPIIGSPPNLLKPPPGCSFCARCPKAMRICEKEAPPVNVKEGHIVSCWLEKKT